MGLKVHHLGYAVNSIEDSVAEFESLGWVRNGSVTDDVARKVRIQFMHLGPEVVELVAPLADDSPIRKILQKGTGTPYHICYEAESLEDVEVALKGKRFMVFKKPMPAPAIGNRCVEWFFSKNHGIIEVVESERGKLDDK